MNSTTATTVALPSEAERLAECDRRARQAMARAAANPTAENHGWRVLPDGRDLGIAFTIHGASEAVDRLRRLHRHKNRLAPHFWMQGDLGKGSTPFDQCVVGR